MKTFDFIDVDLDGVLCNFYQGAIKAHLDNGHRFPSIGALNSEGDNYRRAHLMCLPQNWQPPGASLQRMMGILDHPERDTYFWKPICQDPFFSSRLPMYPWAKDLLELLYSHSSCVTIVSHVASDTHQEWAGKREWLKWHKIRLMPDKLEFALIRQKWRMSAPNRLLIDDYDMNVWLYANKRHARTGEPLGGKALLFPNACNQSYAQAPANPLNYHALLDYVDSQIKLLATTDTLTVPAISK
jgi:hypothetical protein